jgi:hypothetical protein
MYLDSQICLSCQFEGFFLENSSLENFIGTIAGECRVARFFLEHDTKTGKNVPNEHKMYRMVIKYPKYP